MRAARSHDAGVDHGHARPLAAARAAVWLSAASLGIAMGFNVGLPLPHPERTSRGQAQANQAEVAVLLYPDVVGEGDHAPNCTGCDGDFGSGDLLLAQRDPLPRLDVTLTDDAGTRLTMRTRTLAPGRQQTLFRVDRPGAYTLTLSALPPEWVLCPAFAAPLRLTEADFDATTRRAERAIGLGHACAPGEPTAPPDAPTTEPGTTAAPTAAPPTVAAGDDVGGGAPAGEADGAGAGETPADPPAPGTAGADGDDTIFGGASAAAEGGPSLPHTGQAGRTPGGRTVALAWLAAVAAVLGASGRRLHRTSRSRSAGPRPARPS